MNRYQRGILLLLLLLLPAWMNAQFIPEKVQRYDFINQDKNRLQLHNNPKMESFFQELDSLILKGDRKINILHIGDSHIQAGFFSHHMRDLMQNMAHGLNGGRGFLFPYKMAQTNNPLNYCIRYEGNWKTCKNTNRDTNCSLGLSGISVFTKDSGATFTVSFPRRNNHDYLFNRVRVFHQNDTSAWKIAPADTSLKYLRTYHPDYGYTRFIFDELRDSLSFRIIRKECTPGKKKFTLFGLSFDNPEPGIVYHSVGVNGAKVRSFLRCNLLQQQVSALKPDLIIVSLGTNDAYVKNLNGQKFKYDYHRFLEKLQTAAPESAFLLTAPGDNYRYRRYLNRNTSKATKIISNIAANQNMGFWNFYEIMGKLNSISQWYRANLTARDKLHFNRKGYKLQGDLLFNAMMKAYNNHLKQKSNRKKHALKH